MAFETERLRIRAWRREDAPRVLDIRSRVEVVRWLGTVEPVLMKDLGEATERIREWNLKEDPPCGYWAVEVKETAAAAGWGATRKATAMAMEAMSADRDLERVTVRTPLLRGDRRSWCRCR